MVWACDDRKNLYVFDPVNLQLKYRISLHNLLSLKDKVLVEMHEWTRGRIVVFDRISGMGAIYDTQHMKQIVRFKEFLGRRLLPKTGLTRLR